MLKLMGLTAILVAGGAMAAYAHVTLEQQEAKVGGAYKGVFRVGHGCEGSPTVKIHIQIPDGVISVKPMPKQGWTVETVKGKYDKTYDYFGTPMTEGVREVTWSGGKLLDEHYDEFVLRGTLAGDLATGQKLYFPTVQECEKGVHRWIEIPAAGKAADDYKEPAPGVMLLPSN
jgi:uncharacterized protein YcnI